MSIDFGNDIYEEPLVSTSLLPEDNGELSLRPFIKIYSIPNRSGIIAFSHNDISSQTLSEILSDKYDIATRGGFHCAPLYHKFLKTEKLGLLRASLSPQNTRKEINAFLFALDELSHSV